MSCGKYMLLFRKYYLEFIKANGFSLKIDKRKDILPLLKGVNFNMSTGKIEKRERSDYVTQYMDIKVDIKKENKLKTYMHSKFTDEDVNLMQKIFGSLLIGYSDCNIIYIFNNFNGLKLHIENFLKLFMGSSFKKIKDTILTNKDQRCIKRDKSKRLAFYVNDKKSTLKLNETKLMNIINRSDTTLYPNANYMIFNDGKLEIKFKNYNCDNFVVIEPKSNINTVKDDLEQYTEGDYFNFFYEGLLLFKQNPEYDIPVNIVSRTKTYFESINPCYKFLKEGLFYDKNIINNKKGSRGLSGDQMYAEYEKWCDKNNKLCDKKRIFLINISSATEKSKVGKTMTYLGYSAII